MPGELHYIKGSSSLYDDKFSVFPSLSSCIPGNSVKITTLRISSHKYITQLAARTHIFLSVFISTWERWWYIERKKYIDWLLILQLTFFIMETPCFHNFQNCFPFFSLSLLVRWKETSMCFHTLSVSLKNKVQIIQQRECDFLIDNWNNIMTTSAEKSK